MGVRKARFDGIRISSLVQLSFSGTGSGHKTAQQLPYHFSHPIPRQRDHPLYLGFSFEARGRTFRPVVCHSMSGTLMPMFDGRGEGGIFFLSLLLNQLKDLLPFPPPASRIPSPISPVQLSNLIKNFTLKKKIE